MLIHVLSYKYGAHLLDWVLLLVVLCVCLFCLWYARYTERAARAEWSAYHRWVTGRKL